MKKVEKYIDINTAMSICIKAGLKVFPNVKGGLFSISVDDNGTVITYEKLVSDKDVAKVCAKTYKYFAKKIKIKTDAKKAKDKASKLDAKKKTTPALNR